MMTLVNRMIPLKTFLRFVFKCSGSAARAHMLKEVRVKVALLAEVVGKWHLTSYALVRSRVALLCCSLRPWSILSNLADGPTLLQCDSPVQTCTCAPRLLDASTTGDLSRVQICTCGSLLSLVTVVSLCCTKQCTAPFTTARH